MSTAEESAYILEAVEAAYRSASEGREVLVGADD